MCGKDLLIRLVGFEFWKRLCAEHGIGHDGILTDYAEEGLDRKDVFFYRVGERLNDITERLITAILSLAPYYLIWSHASLTTSRNRSTRTSLIRRICLDDVCSFRLDMWGRMEMEPATTGEWVSNKLAPTAK